MFKGRETIQEVLSTLLSLGYWEWSRDDRRVIYTNGNELVKVATDTTFSWNHNEATLYPDSILSSSPNLSVIVTPFGHEPVIQVYK
jgi:hypothetical protein